MRAVISLLVFILLTNTKCTIDVSGNSSETTNRVAVVIVKNGVDGTAPGQSKVYLYNREYDPVISGPARWKDSIFTGSTGKFAFHNIDAGTYNLFCEDTLGSKSFTQLIIDDNLSYCDTTFDTLRATGTIEGNYPQFNYADSIDLIMYIKGSSYKSHIDSSGNFLLKGVPAGNYIIQGIKINLKSGSIETIIEKMQNLNNVTVLPDSTVKFKWLN